MCSIAGTLLGQVSDSDPIALDTSMLLSYCHDVATGLHYLSSRNMVHRDIAARNVSTSPAIAIVCHAASLRCALYYLAHNTRTWHRTQVLLDAANTCKVSDFGMSSAVGGEDGDCE
jgi:serine/threonine protein kinase